MIWPATDLGNARRLVSSPSRWAQCEYVGGRGSTSPEAALELRYREPWNGLPCRPASRMADAMTIAPGPAGGGRRRCPRCERPRRFPPHDVVGVEQVVALGRPSSCETRARAALGTHAASQR